MLDRFRAFWTRVFTPVVDLLLRWGVSPDAVTVVGTLGVVAGAVVFFPRGQLFVGVLVITAFVFSDLVAQRGHPFPVDHAALPLPRIANPVRTLVGTA